MCAGPKIVITGGAGLVGHNLVHILATNGYHNITVLDKSAYNLEILSKNADWVECVQCDLATAELERLFVGAEYVVVLHAQIGGNNFAEFEANNITATNNVLASIDRTKIRTLVHVSSSVVNSKADDSYVKTKTAQEDLIRGSGLNHVVLRPTLMFGWFDRKHLGWLSRFMALSPIFPIPGDGSYIRQPLYVKDFCSIILGCIENVNLKNVYDIAGLDTITYENIIRSIKYETKARALIIKIPIWLFAALLKIWAIFDRNPPFTEDQLNALIIPETFYTDDWENVFNVKRTPFDVAVKETFSHPIFSKIKLRF